LRLLMARACAMPPIG